MSTNINIRISESLKADAEALFNDIGISLSEAIRLFVKQSLNCGGLPFTPRARIPNSETIAAFKEAQTGEYTDSTLEEFRTSLGLEE
jgi:DNA-damage-inducible protein J